MLEIMAVGLYPLLALRFIARTGGKGGLTYILRCMIEVEYLDSYQSANASREGITTEFDTTFGETDTSFSRPNTNLETARDATFVDTKDSSCSALKDLSVLETASAQADGHLSGPLNSPSHSPTRRTSHKLVREAVPIYPQAQKERLNLPATSMSGP